MDIYVYSVHTYMYIQWHAVSYTSSWIHKKRGVNFCRILQQQIPYHKAVFLD